MVWVRAAEHGLRAAHVLLERAAHNSDEVRAQLGRRHRAVAARFAARRRGDEERRGQAPERQRRRCRWLDRQVERASVAV